MLLLRSNGTLLHMKDCIITFVKLIISKKHNFILYNALTNRDSPNFPLPSNPLPQIVTSNPRLQPDTHFAVDMFPYKTTELFQELGFYSQLPKSPEIRRFLALDFIFLTSILQSQRYFRCPNKVPVSPCLQNTPENGTLCASGICHLAAPARKCPPVPQSC